MNRDVPAESVKDVWIMAGHGGVPLDDYMQYFIEVISLSSHSVIHADSYGALGLYSISLIIILEFLIIWDPALWILQIWRYCACVEAEYHFQFALQLRRVHLAIKKQHYFEELHFHTFPQKDMNNLWDVFENSGFEGFYQQVSPLTHLSKY